MKMHIKVLFAQRTLARLTFCRWEGIEKRGSRPRNGQEDAAELTGFAKTIMNGMNAAGRVLEAF
jgi:hypothetical protein